jgi:uncharacterized protein
MAIQDTIWAALSFLALILGSLLLAILFISAIIVAIAVILLVYSLKTGKLLFPNLLVLGILFFEGSIKAVVRFFGVDDVFVDKLSIDLQNKAMRQTFVRIPYDKRAIFIPQCLRSSDCPARLSPEGIKCKDCGLCEITKAKQEAERLGYSFFIVPGSSFIVRMINKTHPQAIIGVGCLCEIKEGLDLMHKHKIPALGVVLDKAGCVSTILDWDKFYEVMQAYEHDEASAHADIAAGDQNINHT